MFDDIATLFYDNALRSYRDYLNIVANPIIGHSRDIKAAVEAASALYHFREHLPSDMSVSFNDVFLECPDYKLIRDITNASKHGSINRNQPLITRPTALVEYIFLIEYRDDLGPYVDAWKAITVKLDSGSSKDISEVLRNVVNFWIDYLQAHGLLLKLKRYNPPIVKMPLTREECRPLDMVATQGMMVGAKTFVILQYDYEKRVPVSVDLTNAEVAFTVRKPTPIILDVNLKVRERTFMLSLSLDEANSLKATALKTAEERQAFVQELPEFQERWNELCAQAAAWQKQVEEGTADLSLRDAPEEQTSENNHGERTRQSFHFGGIMRVAEADGEFS